VVALRTGDFRQRDEIEAWAGEIVDALKSEA